MIFWYFKELKDTDFTYCKKCRERCVVVITLLHASRGCCCSHLPLYQRHYIMGFIWHPPCCSSWEHRGIYNSHLLELMQCRLLTKGRISNVRPGLWCLDQCMREAINYFAIRISWWPIRIRIWISNL